MNRIIAIALTALLALAACSTTKLTEAGKPSEVKTFGSATVEVNPEVGTFKAESDGTNILGIFQGLFESAKGLGLALLGRSPEAPEVNVNVGATEEPSE